MQEVFWKGKDVRSQIDDPNSNMVKAKELTLEYNPYEEESEKPVLAIAAMASGYGFGSGSTFGLRCESSGGWSFQLTPENIEELGVKCFGEGVGTNVEHIPMCRPADK